MFDKLVIAVLIIVLLMIIGGPKFGLFGLLLGSLWLIYDSGPIIGGKDSGRQSGSEPLTKFSEKNLKDIKEVLDAGEKIPPGEEGAKTVKQHVQHCFCQLLRFTTEAIKTGEFRIAQFCLNLGRAQELLKSIGGVECWWRTFEPLIEGKKYEELKDTIDRYHDAFGFPVPNQEKMDTKCQF